MSLNTGKLFRNIINDFIKTEYKNAKERIYYNNGNRYKGDIINGKREGKGIIYYIDGDIYEGEWKNGKREGKGIYYYNHGECKGNIKENGKTIKEKEKELYIIMMVIDMKEIL